MYCYNVIDDVIVGVVFRKKSGDIKHTILEHIPSARVCVKFGNTGDTLLSCCRDLVSVSEDTEGMNWFASDDKYTAQALAVLCIIESFKCWNVLQDEEIFEKWIEGRIR